MIDKDGHQRIAGRLMRRLVIGATVALSAVLAAALFGWPIYVRPQTDPLRHADAILVLGGPFPERYSYGISLAEEGYAPELVLSTPDPRYVRWATDDVCADPPNGVTVTCFVPEPATTKGEGRELRELAEEEGWRTVIVVTFTPHVSRARHIISACFDGTVIMTASPTDIPLSYWPFAYVYQSAGFVRSFVQPGC